MCRMRFSCFFTRPSNSQLKASPGLAVDKRLPPVFKRPPRRKSVPSASKEADNLKVGQRLNKRTTTSAGSHHLAGRREEEMISNVLLVYPSFLLFSEHREIRATLATDKRLQRTSVLLQGWLRCSSKTWINPLQKTWSKVDASHGLYCHIQSSKTCYCISFSSIDLLP